MSENASASINTGDEGSKGPSLEEQYEALQKEGLVDANGDNPGTPDEPVNENPGTGDEEASEGSTEDRPDWLPEKFKTVEDFKKAYEELERKQSGGDDDDEGDEPEDNSEITEEERSAAEEATKKAGLDLNEVSAEWNTNGGLSAETYDKLEAAGYPAEMVDTYIDGLVSRTSAISNAAYEVVGGQDAYGEMIEWAIDNMEEADQKAFDEAVNSGNRQKVLMAVKGLKADWSAAVAENASEEPEAQLTPRGQQQASGYETMDDYMADLNDPRYDQNESFRKKVMDKLGRSNIM